MAFDISMFLQYLIETWGYFGVFIVNAIGSATIIFPLPGFLFTLALATTLNPWLLGISAGLGSAVGELTGYAAGRVGREAIKEKYKKWFFQADKLIEKHGPFPIIVFFAAAPLPADIVGILSGMISYDVRKFFLAMFIGKAIKSLLLIFFFLYGINYLYNLGFDL